MPDDAVNQKDQAKAAAEKAAAKSPAQVVTLTAAQAAKAVKVTEGELLAWSLRGDTVTVVTTDGQKLVGEL